MKKIGIFILIVIFSITLISCKKDLTINADVLFKDVLEELSDIYTEGDSLDNVTKDLNFRNTTTKLEGVIITWESNNLDVITNSGDVTRTNEDVTVLIRLGLKKGTTTLEEPFIVTVKAVDEEIVDETDYEIVQYTEKFDGVVLSGTYINLNYVGVNDIAWDIVHARSEDKFAIDGKGIMLSGANGDKGNYASISVLFPDGLIDFSFEYRKAFAAAAPRDYNVLITNAGKVTEESLPTFGAFSGEGDEVSRYKYEGPELKGEVTVQIVAKGAAGNKQATFDNFTWRQFSPVPEGQIRHTVTFDTNDGEPIHAVKVAEGIKMPFIPTPIREGFDFVEWVIGDVPFDVNTLITKDIILTATWETSKNTVTLDFGYIEVENVFYRKLELDEAFAKPHEPDREGYSFVGWYQFFTNVDNHIEYDFSKAVTGDIRLIAKWDKDIADPVYVRDDNELDAYYDPIKGKTGEDLMSSLRTVLTNTHEPVNYGLARQALEITDRHPYDDTMVLGIYDRAMYVGPWDHPNWEREHVWPNSKLGVDRAGNTTINQASDLHNLRAILPVVNQRRGNRYFVNPTELLYSPVGHIVGDGMGTYYPGDEDIGDVARIFLYMAVRYDVLKLTDNHDLLRSGDTNKTNNSEVSAYMGTLSLLYDWHLKDPVDDFERNRNNLIDGYQNNRNPFIDHPELFEEVHAYFMQVDIERNTATVSFVINDTYTVHIDYTFFKKEKDNIFIA